MSEHAAQLVQIGELLSSIPTESPVVTAVAALAHFGAFVIHHLHVRRHRS